jgi:hypothetical protein
MQVEINHLESTVQSFDSDVSQEEKIVRKALQAFNDQEAHRKRVHAEQRITAGISTELEEER